MGEAGNALQYTGRENDDTGLYYYRARYYDPALKRFITSDPIGLRGGLNTYAYVLNSPLRFVDPAGLAGSFLPLSPTEAKGINDALNSLGGALSSIGGSACEACMKAVAAKYDPLPVHDKYKHCMVGAEGAKKCGSLCAGVAAIGKEYRDLTDENPNTNPEVEDALATFDGIGCASEPVCGSFEDCCRRKGRNP